MRRVGSLVARACLRLYPRRWRERYGTEVRLLVDDAGARPRDLLDLAFGGLRERAHDLNGGGSMNRRVNLWAALVAGLAALIVAMPTAAFVALNLFPEQVEWLTGLRGPFGVGPEIEWMLPALPMIALVIAITPAIRVRVRRDQSDGTSALTVRMLPMPRLLTVVVVVVAILVGVVVAYGISENLLEAFR